jgi:hypothetical protein
MTVNEFQRRYHEYMTEDAAAAEAEAAKVNAEGIDGGRKAVVTTFGGIHCLMLDTAAEFVAEIFGAPTPPA